jgi:CRISPR/Cas system CMR subunit Cmr4 (Cas7 group RAMP superfamily)
MKQLLIILAFILPVIVKSQDTIKIPTPIAKTIAKELVGCDSIKAVHELTKEQLTLTENKVVLKDSIISNYVKKGIMYEERIQNEQSKFKVQGQWVNELRKQNKMLKTKLIFTKIVSVVFIALITYINLR